jgi:hypothetical protein
VLRVLLRARETLLAKKTEIEGTLSWRAPVPCQRTNTTGTVEFRIAAHQELHKSREDASHPCLLCDQQFTSAARLESAQQMHKTTEIELEVLIAHQIWR